MRSIISIATALLFILFTTGIHADIHRCLADNHCQETASTGDDCCSGAQKPESDHCGNYGMESNCCQQSVPGEDACCEDTRIDYQLSDTEYMPAPVLHVYIPHTPTPSLQATQHFVETTRGWNCSMVDEPPGPLPPFYILFHSLKVPGLA